MLGYKDGQFSRIVGGEVIVNGRRLYDGNFHDVHIHRDGRRVSHNYLVIQKLIVESSFFINLIYKYDRFL